MGMNWSEFGGKRLFTIQPDLGGCGFTADDLATESNERRHPGTDQFQ